MDTTTTSRTELDASPAEGRGTTISRSSTLATKGLATIWPAQSQTEQGTNELHPVHSHGDYAPGADRGINGRSWDRANPDRVAPTTTGPARSRADAAAESMAAQRPAVGAAIRRAFRQLRAVAFGRSATSLDLPVTLDATDAELARLNRNLDHESTAETLRATALATHAGMSLLR